jgi:DNA polymerase IV
VSTGGPAVARWILHVDLDAFFASVEELLDPALRGKPLVVGGRPEGRGVVSSASYAARAFGVRSAMPVAQALRLCPQVIVVPARHQEYSRRSHAVMDILYEITPAVQQISIDEACLDVTGCERLWGPPEAIGRLVQRRVRDEQGLPISVGIAANRLVAKIACDAGKPQGLVLVPQGEEAAFLAPRPIETLWGVGQVTGRRLRALGIATIGDLAAWDEERAVRTLGERHGRGLWRRAQGLDASPVQPGDAALHPARRSISQEQTFAHDVADRLFLERTMLRMSEAVAARLRRRRWVAQTVRIKLRDPDFVTQTRQETLAQPTDQPEAIYAAARRLLHAHWTAGSPLRLLGVGVDGLLGEAGYQLTLFERQDQRRIRLNRALDEIRDRFGDEAITRAALLRRQHRSEEPDSTEGA